MQRKVPWWSILGIVLVLAGIAGYNIWAYNCGFCAIQDMKTVGPQTRAVAYLVLGAAICWAGLFVRRWSNKSERSCGCGRHADAGWSFCPDCGGQLP